MPMQIQEVYILGKLFRFYLSFQDDDIGKIPSYVFPVSSQIQTFGLFIINKVLDYITAVINMHLTNETYVVALDDLIAHICFLL